MLKPFSEEELFSKPRSAEQEMRIRALEALQAEGDEGIDFSDIPEIREIPPGAVRGISNVPRAEPVYLDRALQIRLSAIAARKGVSLSALVSQLLRQGNRNCRGAGLKSWTADIDPATIPDGVLKSERARRNAVKRTSYSGGVYWKRHNPETTRCRCQRCMERRVRR